MTEEQITYFEKPGRQNTEQTLEIAFAIAREHGIETVVLASTTGDTARKALQPAADDIKLVVIPHQYGWTDEPEFDLQLIPKLEECGHQVHFSTMLFHTDDLYGTGSPQALANLLRIFGQGMKVCIEIILMAADAGLVSSHKQVVAVAGTGRGADTAIVATPASSMHLSDLQVHRILCKPL